jgi:predicted dienelactone hydrolase
MVKQALLLWTCMLAAMSAVASEQSISLAGLNVTVWSTGASVGRQPVIIFSHGYHGCATQSRFLMEAFASAGYLIFAPNHRDAMCDGGSGRLMDSPSTSFKKPDAWDDHTYKDRADDIRRLIAVISTDDRFRDRVDLSRLGLAGHSLGGYTVLGLAGAWPSWKLPGVKAVLALSPYSQPYILHQTLTGLTVPVMFQGGTRDFGVTPAIDRVGGGFDLSPAPKYLVEFEGATHFAWTNLGVIAREQIVTYSVAFMNRYVKDIAPEHALTHSMPGVAQLRYVTETGESDKAQAGR